MKKKEEEGKQETSKSKENGSRYLTSGDRPEIERTNEEDVGHVPHSHCHVGARVSEIQFRLLAIEAYVVRCCVDCVRGA